MAGDEGVVEVSREAPPEHILRILARIRYQTQMTNSLSTVTVIKVRKNDGKRVT